MISGVGQSSGGLLSSTLSVFGGGKSVAPSADGLKSNQEQPLQAGFGAGTVSIPTLAARTINRNMDSARQAVDLVQQLQQDREIRAEAQQRATQTQQNAPELDLAASRKTAAAAAQDLLGGMNRAAETAMLRAMGGAPQEENKASIQIAGQTTPYALQNQSNQTTATPTVNLFA